MSKPLKLWQATVIATGMLALIVGVVFAYNAGMDWLLAHQYAEKSVATVIILLGWMGMIAAIKWCIR